MSITRVIQTLDLKLGIKPKAGNFLSGKREGEGERERKRERERERKPKAKQR